MTDDKKYRLQHLRIRAEYILQNTDGSTESHSRDISELIHELQVYHAELELQLEDMHYAYEELEDSQRLYLNLFNFAPIGYIVTDKRGVILEANKTVCQMLNMEPEELKSRPFAELMPDSEKDRFHLHHRAALNSRQQQKDIIQLRQKTGNSFLAQLITWHRDGNLPTLQTAILDYATLQQTQQELQQLEQPITQETGINQLGISVFELISHHFHMPLSNIIESAEILDRQDERMTREQKKSHYQKIIDTALYLSNLVDDVKRVGEVAAQFPTLRLETFDLLSMMHQLKNDVLMLSTQKQNLHLKINTYTAQEWVTWDRNLFRQIILNLISSGFQYPAADVTCMVDCKESIIRFQITDQRTETEDVPQRDTFEAFYRGKDAEFVRGTGIGLYMVERAVKIHGGAIHSKSAKDQGTTFMVELPRHLTLPSA